MITLTVPHEIRVVLGADTAVSYEKMVIAPMSFDGVAQLITGTVRVVSTSSPSERPIIGSFRASVATSELIFEIPQLDILKRIVLSSPLNDALLAQVEAAQLQIENGLLAIGVVSGVRTPGV